MVLLKTKNHRLYTYIIDVESTFNSYGFTVYSFYVIKKITKRHLGRQ